MPTATRPLPAKPACLRVEALRARPVGVDAATETIRGYVLAQEGPFKSAGRGEFDRASLREIVTLANAARKGLRSRFTHPGLSSDGLGKYLGRARGAWLDQSGPVWMARADLHISPSSHDTPSGDLGGYVLRLAAEDPDALSSSLVIEADEEFRLNADGTAVRDKEGEPLPPLWRPRKLWATDVVDTGDAVDGMLSADHLDLDALPDALQRQGWKMLDRLFAGQPEDVVRERVTAYLGRYLSDRYGVKDAPKLDPAAPPPVAERRPNLDAAAGILRRLATRR